jgi:hypothetical protein
MLQRGELDGAAYTTNFNIARVDARKTDTG